uniref:Putative ficolin/ixoderin n=1 Tax=Ixodes ricinus TaxID=34613 RepID=A0A147BWQ6_IXORI
MAGIPSFLPSLLLSRSGCALSPVALAVMHDFSETEYSWYPNSEDEKRVHSESLRADSSIDFQVIQRRTEYEVRNDDFEKEFVDYERGFTTKAGGALWIGLETLHALTSIPNNQQVLRIELKRKHAKETTVLLYNKFRVGAKGENYKLTIGDYQGPEGTDYDALSYHNGYVFTTKKSMTPPFDIDQCSGERLSGGWWFNTCNQANLNGRKFTHPPSTMALGITWHIKNKDESYRYIYDWVEMKIRDSDFGFCTGRLKS